MVVRECFVGNIPFQASREDVEEFLVEHGHVVVLDFQIRTDRNTGKSKGYGFARLGVNGSPADFNAALERLQGKRLQGRIIQVSLSSREREKQARQGVAA